MGAMKEVLTEGVAMGLDPSDPEFVDKVLAERGCPRCAADLRVPVVRNALSRLDNETYVCSSCGTAEAVWNFQHPGKPLPGFREGLFL